MSSQKNLPENDLLEFDFSLCHGHGGDHGYCRICA